VISLPVHKSFRIFSEFSLEILWKLFRTSLGLPVRFSNIVECASRNDIDDLQRNQV
jgi:hypothetical protein